MANKLVSLRRKSDFFSLQNNGKRCSSTRWMLLVFKENGLDHSRFGWTIPKKVGSSVIRNRLKRWLRDYFRSKTFNKSIDLNVVIRANEKNFFKTIEHNDFISALDRASDKVF
ncbi:MAG: ribonuclease P protein component [Bdellovibrionales bacterium]|nr:ribonuclease P protein component [Bdellovibrionales bacterium]